MSVSLSTMAQADRILGTDTKTATMELTAFEWKVILIALKEASTMPNMSMVLAEELAELIAVQTEGVN